MTNAEKLEFWREHIEKQQKSRQSRKVYCKENSINLNTFNWRRRNIPTISSKIKVNTERRNGRKQSDQIKTFLPIQLKRDSSLAKPGANLIELSLSEDMKLSLSFKANISIFHSPSDS